jgi:hypothetical protein
MARVRSRAIQDVGCPSYWLFRQVVRGLTAIHEPNQAQRADLAVLAPGTRSHERGRGMIRMRVACRS